MGCWAVLTSRALCGLLLFMAQCPKLSYGCSVEAPASPDRLDQIEAALVVPAAHLSEPDRRAFANVLAACIRKNRLVQEEWVSGSFKSFDIRHRIRAARDVGCNDEACWQCFLATHFGTTSAQTPEHLRAANQFYCGFSTQPVWTWNTLKSDPTCLQRWLMEHRAELLRLHFGNHRKHEARNPEKLWKVIDSFIHLATEHGSPAAVFAMEERTPEVRFERLMRRLCPLHRFGRLAKFDLLVLLDQVGLIEAKPDRVYLDGASGPLRGARKLWGDHDVDELERRAADLARSLGVSLDVIENALCNWQK